ncbi:hypothetical protein HME9304_02129 [Flagellimonas maritima]|uniref:YD repeat-containing protein n=2 Tax=Flagellimonas maritima TaxID=1383885 RepID=A0A2Z4LTQ6_9FLAO|nr:hypothetical protein HME9304_02129 [Allomuricauda aurantiaca]
MLLVIAQNIGFTQDFPKITPPSPEATALAKFTEIPVSHYTGVPNISIPIHTIQQNGINIPVSLNYHSRGIKVEEIAPRYGLGWALQYGGSISRQTRGETDESQYGYLNNNYDMDFFTDANKRGDVQDTYTFNQEYDFTPDLFHFNVNGIGGKFIIDKADGEVLVQGLDDIDITYLNQGVGNLNGIDRFVITDKHGNKFYFGVSKDGNRTARNYDDLIEGSRIPMYGGRDPFAPTSEDYFNSWQLMEIETSYGDMIEFHYYQQPEASYTFRHLYDKIESESQVPVHYTMKLRMYQYQLSEIRFNKGKLVFQRSLAEREDLHGSYTLDKIGLYDKQDNPIKSYELGYMYTTSIADNNVHDYLELEEPRANKRLFLSSIQETAPNQEQLPPYIFEYSTVQLPNRFSNSQDLWGYFNGKNNGQYLTFFDYGQNSVDRTVDVLKAEAGLLKKITYPTKGSTNFVYEQNKAIPPLEFAEIVFQNVNPIVDKGVVLSHIAFNEYYDDVANKYERPFTIGEGLVGNLSSDVSFNDTNLCLDDEFDQGCKFRVFIEGNNIFFELFLGENENSINISPGAYKLIVEPQFEHDPLDPENDGFTAYISWVEEEDANEIVYAGGKRIKKINYDDANGSVRTKEYEYLDNLGNTSGRIFGLPNFYAISDQIGDFVILEAFGSVPGSPLGTPQGNSVGYAKVTEYYGKNNTNSGKTEYDFSVIPDAGKYYEFPYPLPTDNEWLRGKMLKSEVFKKNTGIGYTLLKKMENTYLYGGILDNYEFPPPIFNPGGYKMYCNSDSDPGYSKDRRRYHLPLIQFIEPDDDNCNFIGGLAYSTYYLTGGTLNLGKSLETSYFEDGLELTTTTEYFYDYDEHYQLSTVKTIDSEEITRVRKMYYATDVNDVELLNRHRLSEVVRQETYMDVNNDDILQATELLSKKETRFRLWDNNQYLSEFVKSQKGMGPFENRIAFTGYDHFGNPLQLSKTDGAPISYIWGYNKQYPIAKIENASYADIFTALGITMADLKAFNEDNLEDINNLRNNPLLPGAMITTYAYRPLVGIMNVTDTKGYKISYEYDAFNRLKEVEDHNSRLLSEYQYKYKDQ